MNKVLLRAGILALLIICPLLFYTVSSRGDEPGGASIPVPSASTMALGNALYHSKCASCHGDSGKGDGPTSTYLNPRPRDFTSGKFKIRTTESGSIPTDADLERTILSGLHGTPMPDWKPYLRGDTLASIIQYVKAFSPRFQSDQPKAVAAGNPIASTPAGIADGRKVYVNLQCAGCHGDDGNGKGAVSKDLKDDWDRDIAPPQLNEPWTFKGGATAQDVYLRLKTGMDGAPMPSFNGAASEKDLWNLANYIVSLGRKPVWEMNAGELKAFYDNQAAEESADPVKRGKYLVETHGCTGCHTPVNRDGSMIEELRLAGGMKGDLTPFGVFYTYNLTSDKETGLGNWTDDQIKNAITKGIAGKGWHMLPFPMPWAGYAQLTDADMKAVIAYLRSLPPVKNKIPVPEHPNIFTYLWQKFQYLIVKKDMPGKLYPGNWGTYTKASAAEVKP